MYAQITLDGRTETLHAPAGEQLGIFEIPAVSTFDAPAPEPIPGDVALPMHEPMRPAGVRRRGAWA